jgi:hypothetical protein
MSATLYQDFPLALKPHPVSSFSQLSLTQLSSRKSTNHKLAFLGSSSSVVPTNLPRRFMFFLKFSSYKLQSRERAKKFTFVKMKVLEFLSKRDLFSLRIVSTDHLPL